MDADGWDAATDAKKMIAVAAGRASGRKFRLFLAACARDARPGTTIRAAEQAIALAERFADGLVEARRVTDAYDQIRRGWAFTDLPYLLWPDLARSADAAVRMCGHADPAGSARRTAVLREVLGNPFRPVVPDERWLTATARGLARAAYDLAAFEKLPVLADALEDAGCDSGELLAHLRADGPHYRGCWAVDLVLGKS